MAGDGGTPRGPHGADGTLNGGDGTPTFRANLDLSAELARNQARHLLDVAIGVLVAQQSVEPAVAAESLSVLAAGAGLAVTDLAADIVNGAAGVPTTETPEAGADAGAAVEAMTGAAVGVSSGVAAPPGPRARRQVASLAEVAGDFDEVSASVLHELRPLGVRGVLLWRRTASDCLHLVGSAGFSPLDRAQWGQIPPQWRALPQRVLGEEDGLWLPDGVADPRELPGPDRTAARALVPLRFDGRSVGVALVCWREPHELGPDVRRRVVSMLEVLARVLSGLEHVTEPGSSLPVLAATLDLLTEPAMTLRRGRKRYGDEPSPTLYVEHMNAAAYRFGSGVPRPVGRPLAHVLPVGADDLTAVVADAYRHGALRHVEHLPFVRVPDSAPMLDVRVLPVSAERCVVLWHREGRDHSFSVLKRAGRLGSLAAFEDDTARGVTQWSEQVAGLLGLPEDAEPVPLERVTGLLAPEDRPVLAGMLQTLTTRMVGVSGVVRIPRGDGGLRQVRVIAEPLVTHGTLTGMTGFFQDVSTQHQTQQALAATFDVLGSVQEQAALRHRLALQLQQAIVPEQQGLSGLPGLRVAGRYRPAAEEYRVGGDWYDVLSLPDGRVMIAVGDVAGHGIDAATGMVALRNALRGLACSGLEPGLLMRSLNEVALRTSGRPTATALCAHFDPADHTLRWANAGHLPALLLRDGRARLLESAPNLLLGAVPRTDYTESRTQLRPGDQLLLFTDGLIERRRSSLDDALALLVRAVERTDHGELEAVADALMATSVGDTDDDASLVLVRLDRAADG